jgi:hypothetical protein
VDDDCAGGSVDDGELSAFICCACVAKSSASILFRADSHRPLPSLIASAIPVSASVAEVLSPDFDDCASQ